MIAFLAQLVPVFAISAKNSEWPTEQTLVWVVLAGVLAAANALRAFIDGANERAKNGNGNKTP